MTIHCALKTKARATAIALLLVSGVASGGSLSIGPFGQGVFSGTTPFNTTGTCTNPGDDCDDTDTRVRSGDLIQFTWSIAANGIEPGEPNFETVIFEQTIHPNMGAVISIDEIPTICLAPPFGPGGVGELSSLNVNADNSITLVCNLGSMGNGDQKSFAVSVLPLGTSVNDSTFTTTQFVYALDADGNRVVVDQVFTDTNTYEVSSVPAFDLIADRLEMYESYIDGYDLGAGKGYEKGYVVFFTTHIAADASMAGKGIEALKNGAIFKPVISAVESDGVTPIANIPHKIVECAPNSSWWENTVYGKENILDTSPLTQSVVDSGDCTISGDHINGHTMTISNLDMKNERYPDQTMGGSPLGTGPYFVASYRQRVWIPFSAIDEADGVIGNNSGSIQVQNCLTEFDPVSGSGVSNYGGGYEPGYNGSTMPDGSLSNNCTGPLTLEIEADAGFDLQAIAGATDEGEYNYGSLVTSYSSGDGLVEPTMPFGMFANFYNRGSVDLNNTEVCVRFDNSVAKLVDANAIGSSAGKFAFIAEMTSGGFNPQDWLIEYGSTSYVGDDPLDSNGDGVSDFNLVTDRYEGDWSAMRSERCDNPSIDNWSADPEDIGIDEINIIRVQAIDSTTISFDPGQNIKLIVPLEMREVFYGGNNADKSIPSGTVFASMGSVRSDEYSSGWSENQYEPSVDSFHEDGDRVTYSRVLIDVDNSTHVPLAAPNDTTSVLSGNEVVWQLNPIVSSKYPSGGSAENLRIVNVLPSGLDYDLACTERIEEGNAADLVEYDVPAAGETRLTWFVGTVQSISPGSTIRFCTSTDSFLPSGTLKTNTSYAQADNAVRSAEKTQGIVLEQSGAIQAAAKADSGIDMVEGNQAYTLSWFNFSKTAQVANPTIINVLPFIGDGDGKSARTPASDFTGSLSLTDKPSVHFSDGTVPELGDPVIGVLRYTADVASSINHDPTQNLSNWCEFDGTNFVNPSQLGSLCPEDWASVTAIRFDSNYSLDIDGTDRQGAVMNYTLSTSGNASANTYTNTFGLGSSSLPSDQYLKAQNEVVKITSFSIGDFIFTDMDDNGFFSAGIDLPAPDGTPVELYRTSDNKLLSTKTTLNGVFLFNQLSVGDYYLLIPASVFTANQPYSDWSVAVSPKPANDDNNQDYDHSAIVLTDKAVDGIRSDTITLSLQQPSSSSGALIGGEPVRDNTFNLLHDSTNDSFSNLTIDLAIKPGDADADGILDIFEYGIGGITSIADTDGDGEFDYRDIDSDNDGVLDGDEAGSNLLSPIDTDNDGIPNFIDFDSDGDGIPDVIEVGANSASPLDTDNDGTPDFLDADSDNDGISDRNESNLSDVDSDGDGIDDTFDVDATGGADTNIDGVDDEVIVLDTDGDGAADHLDLDSDNDGINDIEEAGLVDSNGDGMVDGFNDIDSNGLHDDLGSDGVPDTSDSDNDGIVDRADVDSDNDGIPDSVEGNIDTDGDTIADYKDADSDNDGIPDAIESGVSGLDSDGDGIDDTFDVDVTGGVDANADGIDDAVAESALLDSDADGINDLHDLDSDNDGLADLVEAGGVDSDGDGLVDDFTDADGNGLDDETDSTPLEITDSDGDGASDYIDSDSDNDGIPDSLEGTGDSDNDGTSDWLDTDSDNDTIPDGIEAGVSGIDSDGDGIDDIFDVDLTDGSDINKDGVDDVIAEEGLQDSDSDGIPDFLDIDSDADGIPDVIEVGVNPTVPMDSDNDGVADYLETDSDNDGIPDSVEANLTGSDADDDGIDDLFDVDMTYGEDANDDGLDDEVVAAGLTDSDGNGMPDFQDTDSDGDTIPDAIEAGVNPSTPTDSDTDGIPDYLDTDSDNDGIADMDEGVSDSDGDGLPDYLDTDADGDGFPDAMEGVVDSDGDGVLDYRDSDSDNDGLYDADEGNEDSDNDGTPNYLDKDSDGDGIPDSEEGNYDSDADGIPNYLDPDSDGDRIPDSEEGSVDSDGDSIPNYLDKDSDNDGILDSTESTVDTDGDGIVDRHDRDSDNDGLSDLAETQGLAADLNVDGVIDNFVDLDGDGVDDVIQLFPVTTDDVDNDGLPDHLDTDSDNDGIPDLVEAGGIDSDGDGIADSMLDTDGDGILDNVDVSQTFGRDADGDGIDDRADVDFIEGASDMDGDGVADEWDADVDGDGFANVYQNYYSITNNWPDVNQNGVPDLKEVVDSGDNRDLIDPDLTIDPNRITEPNLTTEPDLTTDPEVGAAEPGAIKTGVAGVGCSVFELTSDNKDLSLSMIVILASLLRLSRISSNRNLKERRKS